MQLIRPRAKHWPREMFHSTTSQVMKQTLMPRRGASREQNKVTHYCHFATATCRVAIVNTEHFIILYLVIPHSLPEGWCGKGSIDLPQRNVSEA